MSKTNLIFLYVLFGYILFTVCIFALSVVLLNRIVAWNDDVNNPTRILKLILAIAILISILAFFTYLFGIPITTRYLTGYSDFGGNKRPLHFFALRMLFFTISLISAWMVYVDVKKENGKGALTWAFVLENIMIVILIITSISAYDQYKYIKSV